MKKASRKITIEVCEDGLYNVSEAEKYANELAYEEMLGLITSLTLPLYRPCIHWMRTKEQHEAYKNSYLNKPVPDSK